ncbi:MAG TPA: P-type conjugative transfer protein VirB9 [Caulobacterales bacterium]|nr:P-type conjugative transfer protein VirB9 [Caulobacterales bacterium]
MRRTKGLTAALIASALLAGAALAEGVQPSPGPEDPRIRYVRYDPDQVIDLAAHLGYQLMIEFGDGEQIENVSIGDSVSWQITPNRAANLLFVKPVERNAATNMTVVTNLRRYSFQLTAFDSGRALDRVTYDLRFIYPAPPEPQAAAETAPAPPPTINARYSFTGSRQIEPTRVYDDGRFTYFQFAEGADAPAIFVIGPDGGEELVNQQVRDGYTVVDRVADEFVLRYGKRHTNVRNDRGRPERKGWWPFSQRRFQKEADDARPNRY